MTHPVFSYLERVYANERIELVFTEDNQVTITVSVRGVSTAITITVRELIMLIDSKFYG